MFSNKNIIREFLMRKKLGRHLFAGRYNRKWTLALFDLLCCVLVAIFYYELIYKAAFRLSPEGRSAFLLQSVLQTALIMLARFALGLYGNIWRYDNAKAYLILVIAESVILIIYQRKE